MNWLNFWHTTWTFPPNERRVTHRLLYRPQDAALDVGDGLGVDGSQLVDQPVVQRQQGQVEEQTLSHCVLGPGSSHLCLNKHTTLGGVNGGVIGNDLFCFQLDISGVSLCSGALRRIMVSTSSLSRLRQLLHTTITVYTSRQDSFCLITYFMLKFTTLKPCDWLEWHTCINIFYVLVQDIVLQKPFQHKRKHKNKNHQLWQVM